MPGAVHSEPRGHASGAVLLLGQKVPAAHTPLTAVSPLEAQYDPPAHATGADRPVVAHTEPAAHVCAATKPPGQYEPRGHAVMGAACAPLPLAEHV
jgi:hypothetical protein